MIKITEELEDVVLSWLLFDATLQEVADVAGIDSRQGAYSVIARTCRHLSIKGKIEVVI